MFTIKLRRADEEGSSLFLYKRLGMVCLGYVCEDLMLITFSLW